MLSKMSALEAEQTAKRAKEAAETSDADADAAKKKSASDDAALQLIRDEMSAKFEEFASEKAALADKLRHTEEQAVLREKLMGERLEKERDELKKSVAKMKEEFFEERRQKLERDRADSGGGDVGGTDTDGTGAGAGAVGADGKAGSSMKTAGLLNTKKSLYDLLGESTRVASTDGSTLEKPVKVSRDITTVDEGNEDDAPLPGAGGVQQDVPPIPPELEGLPAPHTAGAISETRPITPVALTPVRTNLNLKSTDEPIPQIVERTHLHVRPKLTPHPPPPDTHSHTRVRSCHWRPAAPAVAGQSRVVSAQFLRHRQSVTTFLRSGIQPA